MQTLIDIIGSVFMGAAVILIITNFNLQMMRNTKEQVQGNASLYKAIGISTVIEYDIYKAGYRDTTTNSIVEADSTRLTFRADIDNNATIDSVKYTISSSPEIRSSGEYALYRQVNSSQALLVGHALSFIFLYYDSMGVQIPYGSLTSATHRTRIRTIEVNAVTRSESGLGDSSTDYQSTVWNKKFRPKNL